MDTGLKTYAAYSSSFTNSETDSSMLFQFISVPAPVITS